MGAINNVGDVSKSTPIFEKNTKYQCLHVAPPKIFFIYVKIGRGIPSICYTNHSSETLTLLVFYTNLRFLLIVIASIQTTNHIWLNSTKHVYFASYIHKKLLTKFFNHTLFLSKNTSQFKTVYIINSSEFDEVSVKTRFYGSSSSVMNLLIYFKKSLEVLGQILRITLLSHLIRIAMKLKN